MKSIVYKNPVTISIFLSVLSTILGLYSISRGDFFPLIISILITNLNRKVIYNAIDMSKEKKLIIYINAFIMAAIILGYTIYHSNMLIRQIIK